MFVQIGDDQYSCVAPPGFEKDPAVTAAIQEFDAGVIPIWRLQRWRFPGESKITLVVHHGLGRYYPYPRQLRRRFHVQMPLGAEYPAPNFLDAVFEDTSTVAFQMGGPGAYMPWDWSIYRWCRRQFDSVTVKKWEQMAAAHRARLERYHKEFEEELEYRKKQIEPWIMKKLDSEVSESDWMQLLNFHAENEKRRKLGLEPIRRNAPKPQVALGAILGGRPAKDETYGRVAPSQGE